MTDFPFTEETLSKLRTAVGEGLSPYRYRHILEVENMIARLGALYCPERIPMLRAAALLHDLTKEYPAVQHEEILDRSGVTVDREMQLAPKLYHAMTAPIVISERFPHLATTDLLEAVRYHTTGRKGMSIEEMLLYLADYIDESRTFPQCITLRDYFWGANPQEMTEKERYLHLLRTLLLSLDMTVKDLLNENAYISADSILARNALLMELNREDHT